VNKTYFNVVKKYFSVGLIATLIHSLVYVSLIFFHEINPQLANLISYLSAVLFSYYFQMKWTFSSRESKDHFNSLWKFLATSFLGYGFNAFFVFIVNDILYINPLYALFGIIIITPSINFILLNVWVFPKDIRKRIER